MRVMRVFCPHCSKEVVRVREGHVDKDIDIAFGAYLLHFVKDHWDKVESAHKEIIAKGL